MCLQKQCDVSAKCNFSISCSKVISYQFPSPAESLGNLLGGNWSSPCFDNDGPFNYGIYGDALPVISSESLSVRVLYPIFWGLLNLRYSFNLDLLTKWKQKRTDLNKLHFSRKFLERQKTVKIVMF